MHLCNIVLTHLEACTLELYDPLAICINSIVYAYMYMLTDIVKILNIWIDRFKQTVQTQIRLLPKEQSD